MDPQTWLGLGTLLVGAGSLAAYVWFESRRRSRDAKPEPRKTAAAPTVAREPRRRPAAVSHTAVDAALESPHTALLVELLATPGMSMRQAAAAANASPTLARRVVARLSGLGLVDVERRPQRAAEVVSIRLTTHGAAVARKLLDVSRLVG